MINDRLFGRTFWTLSDIAKRWSVTRKAVLYHVKKGLKVQTIGQAFVVLADDLDGYEMEKIIPVLRKRLKRLSKPPEGSLRAQKKTT